MATHHLIEARPAPSVLPLLGLSAYLITSIFYVFPSGLPQPADFLLLLVMVTTMLVAWRTLPHEPVLYATIALFAGWIVLVNGTWYFIDPDFKFLRKSSFYIYNAMVILFVVAAGYRDWERLKVVIWWSCVIALLAQILYLEFVFHGLHRRATGTFNNPNQLGYWALMMMACLAVVKERSPLGFVDTLALGAGFYVVMLSLSKAASISGMLLILLILAFCRCRRGVGLLLAVALVLGVLYQIAAGGLITGFMGLEAVANLNHRLSTMGQSEDDNLMHRGYIRLFQNPQYLAFGAGEGAFERMSTDPNNPEKEFHSTLGTILMSYGLIGLSLFGLLLFVIFSRAPLASIAYFGPVMLFSITHVGIRSSEFWVYLGIVYAQARYGAWGPSATSTTGAARLPRW